MVQEAVIKTIPKRKKCKKAKWQSEEALQIAEKKKRSESQGRKGKIYLSECRLLENSNERVFLSEQCKEIEENNRMRKSRYLFKKIRDTKGIFHAKMGTIWTEMAQT